MQNRNNKASHGPRSRVRGYERFRSLRLLPLLALGFLVATETAAHAAEIDSVERVSQFTGDHSEIDGFEAENAAICSSRWVHGTDLGGSYPFSYQGDTQTRFLFGDTFGPDEVIDPFTGWDMSGVFRPFMGPNVLAFSSDPDASDGIAIDDFLLSSGGVARPPVPMQDYQGIDLGPYTFAGFSIPNSPHEFILATQYAFGEFMGYVVARHQKLWATTDRWENREEKIFARLPVNIGGVIDFRHNFALPVTVPRNENGVDYLYIFGKDADRTGHIKVMRIRAEHILSWANDSGEVPKIRTANDWVRIDEEPRTTKNLFSVEVGDASAAFLPGNIQRWLIVYNYGAGIYAAISSDDTPYSDYSVAGRLLDTNSCWGSNSAYRIAYAPALLPSYTECGADTCTVYFLISRMAPGDQAMFDSCQAYSCPFDLGMWAPCHQVYNTFLMKAVIRL